MKRVLVVEDGREYVEAFERLAGSGGVDVSFLCAGSAREALARLSEGPVDAVFLDVVFDRTPPGDLAGDLAGLLARTGGDRARAERLLAESQGFVLVGLLAPHLSPGLRVVLAHDFEEDPGRLRLLRERVPGLVGLPDGARASEALGLLLS